MSLIRSDSIDGIQTYVLCTDPGGPYNKQRNLTDNGSHTTRPNRGRGDLVNFIYFLLAFD